MGDTSIADILALTKDEDGVFGKGGIGFLIIILLFFFMFGGGLGGFGTNNANGLTLTNLERDTLNGQRDIEQSILTTSCATQKGVLENQYANLLGFKDMSAQMASCCCDLRTTMIEQAQETRDLINSHYVSELADKLSLARASINNFEQSQYLLGQLGAYYSKPSVNPYTCYNTCGCGYTFGN